MTDFATWIKNNDIVALHFKQTLLPVEGEGGVIFPATYAAEKQKSTYNIDDLADGTQVASIDSVGSQANRMEPIFKAADEGEPENSLAKLVPQIDITYGDNKKVSIFDAGHRLGDALIRCTSLKDEAHGAFVAFGSGNATPIAKLAPTSLVFGAWDSRDTGVKLPRLVQAVIRAWNVSELKRSAQFNPAIDYKPLGFINKKEAEKLLEEAEKKGGDSNNPLSARGFGHVPAPRTHGGVVAKGDIVRDVTVNLIALRRLKGKDDNEKNNSEALQHYILGLTLVAAIEPLDGFLRAGCLLTLDPSKGSAHWELVKRDGTRATVELDRKTVLDFAQKSANAFGKGDDRQDLKFDDKLAKDDVAKAKPK